ncbi:holdfast anchoring protein HfaA [Maricaulis sp.]|uniref:holdfast anchoring protein HfaA n=1 Tax=Maricaulis sp. TaxID=1486257 RepID=UPI003A8FCA0D
MKTRRITIALAMFMTVLAPASVLGQSVSTTAQWERPYGVASGQETQAWSGAASAGAAAGAGAASRSTAGNRVIIDGVIQTGVGVSSRGGLFGGGVGSGATAIGNQLNVNVSGQYNTVIVNSNQINNGDINANAQSDGNVSSDND